MVIRLFLWQYYQVLPKDFLGLNKPFFRLIPEIFPLYLKPGYLGNISGISPGYLRDNYNSPIDIPVFQPLFQK